MANRRQFLTGLAAAGGLAFCDCALKSQALAATGAPTRLPVKVGGKAVKTIDVHSHCLFHDAVALMGSDAAALTPPINGQDNIWIAVDQRLKAMDAMAIDM